MVRSKSWLSAVALVITGCGGPPSQVLNFDEFTLRIPVELIECDGLYGLGEEPNHVDVVFSVYLKGDRVEECPEPKLTRAVVRVIQDVVPMSEIGQVRSEPFTRSGKVEPTSFQAEAVAAYRLSPLIGGYWAFSDVPSPLYKVERESCSAAFRYKSAVVHMRVSGGTCEPNLHVSALALQGWLNQQATVAG